MFFGYLRRAVVSVTIFIISLCCFYQVSQAGSINGNEASVIAVARGTFEYQGEIYSAKVSYISQLVAKLSQDNVDLTAEQANEAISTIYSNVEAGVKEGYLTKSSDSEDLKSEEKTKEQKKDTKDNKKDKERAESVSSGSVTVSKAPAIIKDTGFSVKGCVVIISSFGVIALICLYMSVHIVKSQRKRGRRT